MTDRERIVKTLNFEKTDKAPMIEWAGWWDQTLARWKAEGLPDEGNRPDLYTYFGLDAQHQFVIPMRTADFPHAPEHGKGPMTTEEDYEKLLPYIFPKNAVENMKERILTFKPGHDEGKYALWLTLEGFFWFPRTLWGIEKHLMSFYDYPELYHRICQDTVNFYLEKLDEFFSIITPDFMSFAEDMSYNKGPMLSKSTFDEFIKPYYEQIIPEFKKRNIKVIIDTDGDVMPMVPWLLDSGIEGILPLERQSGVDAESLRKLYPNLIMIGHFDKRVMKQGEEALRAEFERLLPVMKKGGFIASCDHQTPPDVSLENYKTYCKIFNEYTIKAAL